MRLVVQGWTRTGFVDQWQQRMHTQRAEGVRSSTLSDTCGRTHACMLHALRALVTHLSQIVGGVALTQSYYQHVMLTEGRADEAEACQLLITKLRPDGTVAMLPAQQVRA